MSISKLNLERKNGFKAYETPYISGRIQKIEYLSNAELLIHYIGDNGDGVEIYNYKTGKRLQIPIRNTHHVLKINENKILVIGDAIEIFNIKYGSIIHSTAYPLQGNFNKEAVRFNKDILVIGDRLGNVAFFSLKTLDYIKQISLERGEISAIDFLDSQFIACATSYRSGVRINIIDCQTNTFESFPIINTGSYVQAMKAIDERFILCGFYTSAVIFDVKTSTVILPKDQEETYANLYNIKNLSNSHSIIFQQASAVYTANVNIDKEFVLNRKLIQKPTKNDKGTHNYLYYDVDAQNNLIITNGKQFNYYSLTDVTPSSLGFFSSLEEKGSVVEKKSDNICSF